MHFDPQIDPNFFHGTFDPIQVIDPAQPGHTPNLVVDSSKDFEVKLKWKIEGFLVPLYLAALDDTSDWVVKVYAESVGPGPDVLLTSGSLDTGSPVGTSHEYELTLTADSSKLQEGDPASQNSGVYQIAATVFLNSTLGQPGYDIAGFTEGPMIRVENPV